MDLRQLEIIRAIAETGSFTAAGHKLHVSQSAISRQILLLEDELKEPVFLRVGRRIRITPAGEALLQLSNRVFQDLKDTIAGITDSQESLRGQIRHARRDDGRVCMCFRRSCTELKRQHPDIELKLVTGSSERCIQHLRAGTGDLALLTLPVDQPDMVAVPVMQEELMLVTAAKHPLSRKRKILPQDLVRQPFVLFESGSNTRRVVDEFFMTARIEPQIVMETENVEIIKAMVRNGIGISIIPFQAVSRDVVERSPVLRPHRGALPGARDGLGLSQDEPDAAHRAGSDSRIRPRQAQAAADALSDPLQRAAQEPRFARTVLRVHPREEACRRQVRRPPRNSRSKTWAPLRAAWSPTAWRFPR